MAEPFRGVDVTGTGTTLTTSNLGPFLLDLLTFTVATSSAASLHAVQVSFIDPTVAEAVAVLASSSAGGPSQTVRYTYGVGLAASAVVTANGMAVTDPLPSVMLAPQTAIVLTAIDAVGNTISGDVFSNVIVFGDLRDTVGTTGAVQLIPGLLPGSYVAA